MMNIKKVYASLLIALCAVNGVYPEEHQTILTRAQQLITRLKNKYLRQASTYIKRQYQDEHKRRAWLIAGVVCIATFFSWRVGALQQIAHNHKPDEQKDENSSKKLDLTSSQDGKKEDPHDTLTQEKLDTTQSNGDGKHTEQNNSPHEATATNPRPPRPLNWAEKMWKEYLEKKKQEQKSKQQAVPTIMPSPSNTIYINCSNNSLSSNNSIDASLCQQQSSSFDPSIAIRADDLKAALERAGINVNNKKLVPNIRFQEATTYLIPFIRKFIKQGMDMEQAKIAAQQEIIKNKLIVSEQSLLDAAARVKQQEDAQIKFTNAAQKNDFVIMIEALIDGAIIQNDEFFTAIVNTNYLFLSNEQKIAFDCILWQLGVPDQFKQTLWQRTIKKIARSSYKSIPATLFDPPGS